MQLTVTPASPIGAAITGATIDELINEPGVPEQVYAALEQYAVVFFPAVGFDDEQQVAFGRRLGELITLAVGRKDNVNTPEIYHIGFGDDLNNEIYVKGAFAWHFDGSTGRIPPKGSLLSGRVLAAEGGDTQFVSTYDAYDSLSPELQAKVDRLTVAHTVKNAYLTFDPNPSPETLAKLDAMPPTIHPLAWTHSNGRKSLVLGATASWIPELELDEGKQLIADLMAHATAPERVYTHKWTVGDVVFWDNRATMHRATHYSETSGRRMHRITLVGTEPIE